MVGLFSDTCSLGVCMIVKQADSIIDVSLSYFVQQHIVLWCIVTYNYTGVAEMVINQPRSAVTRRVESLFLISSTAAVMVRSAGRDYTGGKKFASREAK